MTGILIQVALAANIVAAFIYILRAAFKTRDGR